MEKQLALDRPIGVVIAMVVIGEVVDCHLEASPQQLTPGFLDFSLHVLRAWWCGRWRWLAVRLEAFPTLHHNARPPAQPVPVRHDTAIEMCDHGPQTNGLVMHSSCHPHGDTDELEDCTELVILRGKYEALP